MRYRIFVILQRSGLVIAAFFLLSIHGSKLSERSATDKHLRSATTIALPNSRIKAKDVEPAIRASIAKGYGNLPLSFEVNNGQVDGAVKYLSKGNGYTLFLTSKEAVLSVRRGSKKEKRQILGTSPETDESKQVASDVVRLKLIEANSDPKITGLDELPGKSNYFIGNDPAKWRTDVSNYGKVRIEDVYPGIDLVYYGNQRQLEYDWIVNPGADPKTIKFTVEGKGNLKVDAQGDLVLDEKGELRLNKPIIYQRRPGARKEIVGRYALLGNRKVGFQLDKYDVTLPLVIDPVLSYSTYLGSGGFDEWAGGIAVDSSGNAYVTGYTASSTFPTANPFQASLGGGGDAFVTKIWSSASSSQITITASPALCSFEVDGVTYATAQTFSWTVGSSHTIATTSPQSGETGIQFVWSSWSDGGAVSHTVAPTSSTTYTANFTTQYQLTVAASPTSGGTISANPASSDGFYDSGTSVQLTAAPNAGYAFSGWSGDLTGSTNPQSVTMSTPRSVTASFSPAVSSVNISLSDGGGSTASTAGNNGATQPGYATLTVNSGAVPYGTAVFSFKQNGVTVTEAGIPASPPTTLARVFIDWRSSVLAVPGQSNSGTVNINTGIAVVNTGAATANVTYTLRNTAGTILSIGNGTIAAGAHFAKFIDQLTDVAPNFSLPSNFQNTTQFGTLEIASSQPLSVLALRGTNDQRNDFLITTTPVADLTQSLGNSSIYFPQFVDGGGYTTSLVLLNTSGAVETGTLEILDDNGVPLSVQPVGGTAEASFRYSIQPNGAFRLQTDGSPVDFNKGWVRLIPDAGTSTPIGSGIFAYNPVDMLLSESGIASAVSTTHARIYLDLSTSHNTGLAIANIASSNASIAINAFQMDGVTAIGTSQGPLPLSANGHDAKFVDQFITGLPTGFTGVLDISSTTPFAALTIRSLLNERHDFLMTTFPIADVNRAAPSPIVFPQIADGGGYKTQFILLSTNAGANVTLSYFGNSGSPIAIGSNPQPINLNDPFAIDGTILLAGKSLTLEIQAVTKPSGSYYLEADDILSAGTYPQFLFGLYATASISGMSATFSGVPILGVYNADAMSTESINWVDVTITFSSLTTGSSVTGTITLNTPSGVVQGTFSGTLTI